MIINEAQARIKGRVWQAVAQTELDLNGLDKASLEALVDLVSEAALLELDTTLGDSIPAEAVQAAEPDLFNDGKEDVLWEGRPFLSLVLHYTITDERIRITEGLLAKKRQNVELVRIQDMDYKQTVSERMLNLGDITIRSHDSSNPIIVLKNVTDPEAIYEVLRRAVLHARKKHNFTYREEM